jgi:hypothetical protein
VADTQILYRMVGHIWFRVAIANASRAMQLAHVYPFKDWCAAAHSQRRVLFCSSLTPFFASVSKSSFILEMAPRDFSEMVHPVTNQVQLALKAELVRLSCMESMYVEQLT